MIQIIGCSRSSRINKFRSMINDDSYNSAAAAIVITMIIMRIRFSLYLWMWMCVVSQQPIARPEVNLLMFLSAVCNQ